MPKRKNNSKQKSVSVYLGKTDDWLAEVLAHVSEKTGLSESKILHHALLGYFAQEGLYDPKKGEPNKKAITALKKSLVKSETATLPSLGI